MPAPEPTVFVVDDDPAVRASLLRLISSVNLPVKTFESAREFLNACQPDQPGCLILDVRMPGMSGLDMQAELISRSIRLPVIIVTGHGDVPMAIHAMKAGAVEFIQKPYNPQELLNHVQRAMEKDSAHRVHEAARDEIKSRLDTLAPRQREILELVVSGETSKTIARQLGVSPRTVEHHRARMMEKMQTSSTAKLIGMVTTFNQSE